MAENTHIYVEELTKPSLNEMGIDYFPLFSLRHSLVGLRVVARGLLCLAYL